MSIYTKKFLPTLKGKYQATVQGYSEVKNDKGGYLAVLFNVVDSASETGVRVLTHNVWPGKGETFGKTVEYTTNAIKSQLNLRDLDRKSVGLTEMLDLAKVTPINIWCEWSAEYGNLNVSFHDAKASKVESVPVETLEKLDI